MQEKNLDFYFIFSAKRGAKIYLPPFLINAWCYIALTLEIAINIETMKKSL